MRATAPGLIMLPLVLPVPPAYKMYLAIVGLVLFVAAYVIIGVIDFRTLHRIRQRRDVEFKEFVRAETADKP